MEFWGVEVKSGKSLHVKPDPDSYIHISQAALGELKNAQGNDRVVLKVKTGAFDMVVGTLSLGRCDQTALDLIFEKDFHLSHSSTGSVFFCGYKTDAVREDEYPYPTSSGSSESEEDELEDLAKKEAKLTSKQNGKLVPKSEKGPGLLSKPLTKPATFNSEVPAVEIKAKVKPAVADKAKGAKEKVDEDDDDDEDEDEDEDEEDEEEDSDDVMASGSDEEDIDFDVEDDSEEEESQEEELKPTGKKRSAPALQPASGGKKGKVDIAAKVASIFLKPTSGKKESPGKKPGKENISASAAGKKLGQFSCQQCNKNFTSDSALSQHKTAKHKS